MTNSLLRILMAAYLAMWSPAVCCCGIKTAIGRMTGVEVASCGEKAAAPAIDEREGSGGCCAHRAAQASNDLVASCHRAETANSSSSDDAPPPCRCHETVESPVRLDTGAKVTLPALAKIDTLPAMLPVLSVVAMEPSVAEGVEVNDHRSHAPPPRSTLLAQRCLLLI